MIYRLSYSGNRIEEAKINLPASKSISNRVLIIEALCNSKINYSNLSTAQDTVTMAELLAQDSNANSLYDVGPAGTTMRFLTALFSTLPGERILTGSDRMKKRPIQLLVDALRSLGADISYLEKDGYAPLKITGTQLNGNEVTIDGSISSQYISALMLIGPTLLNGLTINISGKLISRPYLEMTASLIRYFDVECLIEQNKIVCKKGDYKSKAITIEPDWSGASYWYSIVSTLNTGSKVHISNLQLQSLQGDAVVAEMMKNLGVRSEFDQTGAWLIRDDSVRNQLTFDFDSCPDIAQTIAVCAGAQATEILLTGLSTLKVKETDRIVALKTELSKVGVDCEITNDSIKIVCSEIKNAKEPIKTYDDHRMAMCFAPLVFSLGTIDIINPEVVVKSYPTFWSDLQKLGVAIESIDI